MNDTTLKLLDACLEAYDLYHVSKDLNGDGKKETFCNFAVDHVLSRFGYTKMRNGKSPMVANQMVDFMRRKAEDWRPVEMSKAQWLANAGNVLVAGAVAEPHGHVVVIRPGIEELSGKWNARAPKVCHVGGNSYIGKSLSWAFPGPTPPQIWMLMVEC